MAKRDFYEVLGVSRGCDEKELKAAFRKLAMQFHPDRNPGDQTAEHKFKEINEAYEILKDPQKRAAYDRFGHAAFENGAGVGAGLRRAISPPRCRTSSTICSATSWAAARRGGSRSGRERGADLRYNMEITLEEAFAGKTAEIEVPTTVACETCSGIGRQAAAPARELPDLRRPRPRARGAGLLLRSSAPARPARAAARSSPTPARTAPAPAASPRSARSRSTSRPASRTAPASGSPARARRACAAGRRATSTSSCRSSRTSSSSATAPTSSAGCRSRSRPPRSAASSRCRPSTAASTRVKVPDGTQTGKQFRLKGKGMPVLALQRGSGDMYIQVVVETPQNLTRRQRELLEEFEQRSVERDAPRIRPASSPRRFANSSAADGSCRHRPETAEIDGARCLAKTADGVRIQRRAPLPQGPGARGRA